MRVAAWQGTRWGRRLHTTTKAVAKARSVVTTDVRYDWPTSRLRGITSTAGFICTMNYHITGIPDLFPASNSMPNPAPL